MRGLGVSTARIEDRTVLEPLAQRGLAAHERWRKAHEALTEAVRVEDAARQEFGDAVRELEAVNLEIVGVGYHDTGHIVGYLNASVHP